MKLKLVALFIIMLTLSMSCKKSGSTDEVVTEPEKEGTPPATWQEHWDVHSRLLTRTYTDNNVAVYHDQYMSGVVGDVSWINKKMSDTWAYVKKNYGDFGDAKDPRLYVICHRVDDVNLPSTAPYAGGHPSAYLNASHDYKNVVDVGLGGSVWASSTGQSIGVLVHEAGHIVCGANNGMSGAPSDELWGDSKFMEIFNYDVFMNIGMEAEAAKVYAQMQVLDPTANYPGIKFRGVNWFMDWFYPIYTAHGRGALLGKYFKLVAANFPANNKIYFRYLNLGEFVHFWSGAAGVNLKAQAQLAFGTYWTPLVEAQLSNAKQDFPNITYTP
ncbi:hypothetical protein LPB86_19755 [Pedobacter sp. MC2016-14]|uniref:hypothetical protein n=1 Tax=Pedobacter sp. MC2016-14 TaxID=2897327 RepID=UPI001E61703E|nr:hypothetical protein [Pedobacter sp. MC2016-14]MCD0490484.1 hypothetical protein [Pedobacter sp. MC2016-14]